MLREYNHQKGLISLHVPKTGGTSFTTIVRDWFSESFYSFYPERDPECIHTKLRAGSCIHGHFNRRLGYGSEAIYPDADQFIAILRDPVLQQISMYHYKMQRYSRGLSSWDWELQGIPRSIDHFLRLCKLYKTLKRTKNSPLKQCAPAEQSIHFFATKKVFETFHKLFLLE